jgi:hypothetical protein
MAVGAVSAVPVLAPNLLHVVEKRNIQRERQKETKRKTERKIRRGRPDGSWRCIRSYCPRTQPPPRGRDRGMDREKDRRRKREVNLMAVGAVSAVPVLAPNLLHVVEKE